MEFNLGSSFYDRPAFIPSPNGYYKLSPCIVENVRHNVFSHNVCVGSDELNIPIEEEQIITLKSYKIEEISDQTDQLPLKSLKDYTNIELLEELEKRTKSNT